MPRLRSGRTFEVETLEMKIGGLYSVSFTGWLDSPLEIEETFSRPGETQGRATAPPHGEEPVEAVRTSGQVFPTGRRSRGRPRTRWRDYISQLVWDASPANLLQIKQKIMDGFDDS